MSRPRLLLAAMGGTISTAPDVTSRQVAASTAADILASVPELSGRAHVIAADVKHKSSRAVTPSDMCELAHRVRQGFHAGCDGVIVTHGTDTMEETAYALALQLERRVPVVLTGAMRPPQAAGADGPANLHGAWIVASDPRCADLGPVVVVHDEIHSARWVTKHHTARVAPFTSPGYGPLGYVVEDKLHLQQPSTPSEFIGIPAKLDKRVELIWASAGADGRLVEMSAAIADGLIIAGTGGGHVPPAMVPAIAEAVDTGLPVVLASRCGSGPLLHKTYGGAGSESQLLDEIGMYPAGELTPIKARLRLLVALALDRHPAEVFPAPS